MQVVLYHEVQPDSLDAVLRDGLECDGQGEKSDEVVQRTDDCLESRKPAALAERGVSRGSVVYGYLSAGDRLVDIRDGREVDVGHFTARREQVLRRFTADCYVSDLDAYDAVKMCVASDAEDALLSRLAQRYWARVVPFDEYRPGAYRRPETMVCQDIAPASIEVVRPDAPSRP